MIDEPMQVPINVLFFHIRKLLEGGHLTAALPLLDQLEERVDALIEIPF